MSKEDRKRKQNTTDHNFTGSTAIDYGKNLGKFKKFYRWGKDRMSLETTIEKKGKRILENNELIKIYEIKKD